MDGALVVQAATGALVAGTAAAATALVAAAGAFVSSARDVNTLNAVVVIKAIVRRYRFMVL
jgi:hypothetical protein